ncbi:hypothetical protein V6N13_148808 [Hibiscus sabdariffa]
MLILRYLSQLSHLKNLKRSRRLQQVEPREGREKNPIEASPTEGGVDIMFNCQWNQCHEASHKSIVPKLWRFDQEEIRKALAKMVVIDELPFSFAEHEGFRAFCKVAIPDFVPPSRATITRDCYAFLLKEGRR